MNKKGVLNILHIKMTCPILRWRYFKLTDLTFYCIILYSIVLYTIVLYTILFYSISYHSILSIYYSTYFLFNYLHVALH